MSLQLFPVVWIFARSLGVICCNRWVLRESHKNYVKDQCLMNSQPTFLFLIYFLLNELRPYYQRDVNPITLNHTTLLNLALHWMWIIRWIKLSWRFCSVWDKLGWLKWFQEFLCEGLSSFNQKALYYPYWQFMWWKDILLHRTYL